MGAGRKIGAVTAAVAARVLVAAAVGRSAGSAGSSTSGNVSPTQDLVAAAPAGVKTVPSITCDVNSLTGAIQGSYPFAPPTLDQLRNSSTVKIWQARSTANPDKRAALVAQAEELTMQQLPWIPNVQPTALLVLGKGLTGAVSSFAYMFAPRANSLGGSG